MISEIGEVKIREPAVAGSFYPYDKNELSSMVDSFLNSAKDSEIEGELKALIVPHAGYIYSGSVAAVGYKLLKRDKPLTKKITLIGPSHYEMFDGVAQAVETYWKTPLGKVRVEQYPNTSIIKNNPFVHSREHSIEVQIPFLQRVLGNFSIYVLLTGNVSSITFARDIIDGLKKDSKNDEEGIIIVSSDLSHYYPYEQAKRIDSITTKAIVNGDQNEMKNFAEACGKTGILTLMEIARINKWKTKLLDYKNSGDTSGNKSEVVGYGCYAFYR